MSRSKGSFFVHPPKIQGRKSDWGESLTLTDGTRTGTFPIVKKAVFHRAVRVALRAFPKNVRSELGRAILLLQKGVRLSMPLSRPIRQVGPGVEELRVKDAPQRDLYRTTKIAGATG